jgi:glycosyltransferase involved in cell wall biosynthesis
MNIPWHISVLIPARNEEDLLQRCLLSVLNARAALQTSVSCDIVVADDGSTDRTYEIASRLLNDANCGRIIKTAEGIVGLARRRAAADALGRQSVPHDHWWLANTDADCVVPANWLTSHLMVAKTGAEALAGTVEVDSFDGHEAFVEQRFQSSYLVQPDGSHPHVHGANLGVRADAYLRAGGWRDLETAEDHDLWERLGSNNCRRLSIASIAVVTSGRRVGRAPHGFAGALAASNEFAA